MTRVRGRHAGLARWALPLAAVLSASCLSVQEFGVESQAATAPDGGSDSSGPISEAPSGTYRWQWANPAPTGNALYAIDGTSDHDIWVAGDGIIAHFDGQAWDEQRTTVDGTRYFAVGARGPKDVWVAGGSKDQATVLHFDGQDWIESYPFASAVFGGFSHGAGTRLFAIVNLGLVELSSDGVWKESPTASGLIDRGPVADVWVGPNDDAWAITTGALKPPTLLHLAPGSDTWEEAGPALPSQTKGLSIAGAGAFGCAFYTAQDAQATGIQDGLGFLYFDQKEWQVGTRAPASMLLSPASGATSACVRGEVGFIVSDHDLLGMSLDGRIDKGTRTDLDIVKRAAWSFDGQHAYAVGDHGLFLERAWDDDSFTDWAEPGPTIRNDLRDVDVGLDGAIFSVDSLLTVVPAGGEVLSWNDRWNAVSDPVAHHGPTTPLAITALAGDDAWVASDEGGHVGVTHFTGGWNEGATPIDGTSADQEDALAIWAPAVNDVWLTGRERCPDPPTTGTTTTSCSKVLPSFAAHFDGSTWAILKTEGAYLAIHGTGPNDVWFAGDGAAHWDGHALTPVPALAGQYAGVWSSVAGRVWLWGATSVLYDGVTTTPVEKALGASSEWTVAGIAESTAGDVFVLTTRSTGTTLLWFDPSRTKLIEQVSSDLTLTKIRGRGNELWAIGQGGASLRFRPPSLR